MDQIVACSLSNHYLSQCSLTIASATWQWTDNKSTIKVRTVQIIWWRMLLDVVGHGTWLPCYRMDHWPINSPAIQLVIPVAEIFGTTFTYDDVIKRKHFPRYWPFERGIHRWPVNSPRKGQWRGALVFSLICAWINGWVNNREAGDLRRHRAHYDVTVMRLMFVKYILVSWISPKNSLNDQVIKQGLFHYTDFFFIKVHISWIKIPYDFSGDGIYLFE